MDVFFIDPSTGWITGVNAVIENTVTAGIYFTDQTQISNPELSTVCLPMQITAGPEVMMALIIHTTNGGSTWSIQTDTVFSWVEGLFFFDDQNGWAACSNGQLLKTTDGGNNWTLMTSGISTDLYDIFFTDPLHGIATGANGVIISTNDGGNNWTPQNSGTTTYLYSIQINPSGEGWAVGCREQSFIRVRVPRASAQHHQNYFRYIHNRFIKS